jgi:hypothetical protein
MTRFHSDDYINFLRVINPDNMSEFLRHLQRCEPPPLYLNQTSSQTASYIICSSRDSTAAEVYTII